MTFLRFDDIQALNAAASDEFGDWSDSLEITQDMIRQFADLTRDQQWIHVDEERAAAGPFGRPIAHGFLVLSFLPKLLGSMLSITGHSTVLNYGADRLRFIAPVPSGSRIHARSRILSATAKDAGTLLKTEVAVHIVGSDDPVLIYHMLAMYIG